MANEYIRKEWAGAAARTTVSGTLTAGATTINVADATSFPAGTFPFVIVLDRGTASEEKVLCSTRGSTSFTVLQRGYDGSVAATHANGCFVEHVLDAYTIDQANALAATMTTVGDIAYKSVTGDNTSFGRLPIGATDAVLRVSGGLPNWGTLNTNGITNNAVTLAKLAANSVDSSKIVDDSIVNLDINSAAAISVSKLGQMTNGAILLGNAAGNSAQVVPTGDVTITNAGLTALGGVVAPTKMLSPYMLPATVANVGSLPSPSWVGQEVFVQSDGLVRRWTGTFWKVVSPMLFTGSLTFTASKASAIVVINLPVTLTNAANAVASCSPITGNTETLVAVRSTSTTQISIQGYMASGSAVSTTVTYWCQAFET